ncbi:hypothetical protein [Streptomyces sp. NPDC059850]|uniref:scabin-related ADP-ribosyltransferase n=1 Tax=Streptomyces sp. NPDC059850 TaxID=3346970 RepID=UPI003646EEDF
MEGLVMQNADYSPALYASDPEGSDGSFDQDVSPEELAEHYARFNPSVSHVPPRTVGFGSSEYGIHPSNVTVARTGGAAGRRVLYRTGGEPLYRFDGRTPEQIYAAGGFQPISDRFPVSLQSYQNTTQRSSLVSFTRDPDPSAEMLERADELSRAHDPSRSPDAPVYRYNMSVPGGIDLTASLDTQSYPDQAEVVFYKGVRGDYIVSATPYGFDAEGSPVQTGPTVNYPPASTQGQPGHSQSQVAWAANLRSSSVERSPSREGRDSGQSEVGAHVAQHGQHAHGGQKRGRR